MESTNPAIVTFELDVVGSLRGLDLNALLTRHKDRFQLMHVKGLMSSTERSYSIQTAPAEIGRGTLDWAKLLPAANEAGVRNFIVEQEPPHPEGAMLPWQKATFLSQVKGQPVPKTHRSGQASPRTGRTGVLSKWPLSVPSFFQHEFVRTERSHAARALSSHWFLENMMDIDRRTFLSAAIATAVVPSLVPAHATAPGHDSLSKGFFPGGRCSVGSGLPIGGHKQSGWGYEYGIEGIDAYMKTKSVYTML
jgi:hypothetical protein